MKMKNTILACLLFLVVSLFPINIWAAESRIILPAIQGGTSFFGEFALDGTLLRNLGSYPAGTRDYTPDALGNLHTYTGTFDPSMMSQNNGFWKSQTLAGWSTVNNLSYGGIVSIGTSVYVTDMFTYNGGEPQGIVRFGLNGETPVRFAQSIEPIDIATDGSYLYALSGNYFNSLSVYNPTDLQYVRSIPLVGYDVRSIAVKQNGELFTADWYGNIVHLSATGELIDRLTIMVSIVITPDFTLTMPAYFFDINLDEETGTIALGTWDQGIYLTDESLDSYRLFTASDSSISFPTEFASFQVVPEPSTLAIGALGVGSLFLFRRRNQ